MSGLARCLHCRATSRVDSDAMGRAWFRQHRRQECTARRSSPTGVSAHVAPVGRARITDAELAEMRATVRRLRPIPVEAASTPRPAPNPTDTSVDAWGARRKGLARQWSNGQCLQASIASVMGADFAKVPDPTVSYDARPGDWTDHYNERLVKATGCRLEFLEAHAIPPRNPGQLWIAGISADEGDRDGHAVVAKGAFVYHDPAGLYLGRLPLHRVSLGMIVRSQRRAVPVFRGRHAIASA